MTLTESLIAELHREAAVTRSLLERVPEEQLSWRPHPRSMSLGQLALHIALLPRGIPDLVTDLVTEVPVVPLDEPATRARILSTLADSVDHAAAKLASWGDDGLAMIWTMTVEGRVALEMSRGGMIRSLMLNHTVHHRGQLTVYLRLLDVALPPVYGPTADENPLG